LRLTLAWSQCMLCGRKGATFECRMGGGRIELCLYCISVLASAGKAKCGGVRLEAGFLAGGGERGGSRVREEPDEALIEALRKSADTR